MPRPPASGHRVRCLLSRDLESLGVRLLTSAATKDRGKSEFDAQETAAGLWTKSERRFQSALRNRISDRSGSRRAISRLKSALRPQRAEFVNGPGRKLIAFSFCFASPGVFRRLEG